MTYAYGDIRRCWTLGDKAYGDILSCETLPGATYPTEALSRVTSLVHRWRPGMFTLTVGLGEVTSEMVLRDVVGPFRRSAGGVTPPPDGEPPGPPPPEPIPPGPELIPGPCVVGDKTCFAWHLYECVPMPTTDPSVYPDSAWLLKEAWSATCGGGFYI
jgi:hypothetical protein